MFLLMSYLTTEIKEQVIIVKTDIEIAYSIVCPISATIISPSSISTVVTTDSAKIYVLGAQANESNIGLHTINLVTNYARLPSPTTQIT